MKRLTLGILAHVDSGKTTLAEAILWHTDIIRKSGRVDHGNSFLDTDKLERQRGITIFSKQARFSLPNADFTLLDTPGHIDFSAEMERTLQVIDYAILVVSGADGVQPHTETVWQLLERLNKPVFLFVNKMDLSLRSQEEILSELQSSLHPNCIDFSRQDERFFENLAVCEESLMNEILASGSAENSTIAEAVRNRNVFPCLFGSALKFQGVEEFLHVLNLYTLPLECRSDFGAKVFKITDDEQGNRLTHLKITNGVLHVRDTLEGFSGQEHWQEKINQIRLYSGVRFQPVEEVSAGMTCAVTGLTQTFSGQGFGTEKNSSQPVLEPILQYAVIFPENISIHTVLNALHQLEQQDPQLHVNFSPQLQEIHLLLMGKIQLDVIQHILHEKFQLDVQFRSAGVAYKETIKTTVEGMGHYEPLRHYAEVRLLLEPAPQGSGLQFFSDCPEDVLEKNWQRLILSHLQEKQHLGVLTGSPLTDVKITLVNGKAHKKHTEGGDFRQATFRAVRQGLMQAESVLLEPYTHFKMKFPAESLGKILSDLQLKGVQFSPPQHFGNFSLLEGNAPAVLMMNYQMTLLEFTHGKGFLSCIPSGYAPCHNAETIIQQFHYQPEADVDNSPDSIFCSHGAGNLIKWNEVEKFMHTEPYLHKISPEEIPRSVRSSYSSHSFADDEELMKIFEQTYGKIQHDRRDKSHILHTEKNFSVPPPKSEEYLLVDGYNIIFSWNELAEIAREHLDSARSALIHRLCNYQGMRQCHLIIVFDAYKVKGNTGSIESINDKIHLVYTKEAETADTYIERISHQLAEKFRVRVATSDGTEQMIILGNGAYRMTAEELKQEILQAESQIQEFLNHQ